MRVYEFADLRQPFLENRYDSSIVVGSNVQQQVAAAANCAGQLLNEIF